MTSVSSSELRDRIAAAIASVCITIGPNSLALLKNGNRLSLTSGEVDAMALSVLATVQPELDRANEQLASSPASLDHLATARATARGLLAERDRLRAELEQARQQQPTDITIHTRKPGKWRFVDTETGQVWAWDVQQNTFKLAGEAAPVEICEIPHATVEEEDACEQQRLAQATQPTT